MICIIDIGAIFHSKLSSRIIFGQESNALFLEQSII